METEEHQVLEQDSPDQARSQRWWLWMLIIFYGTELLICTLARFGILYHTTQGLFVTEVLLSVLALVAVAVSYRQLRPLFTFKGLRFSKAVVYGFAAILFAIVINLTIRWLNKSIFNQDTLYFRAFQHLPFPRLGILIFVAVIPAFIEELAYRGVILEGLFYFSDERRAILMSAIFFAVIHMNFLSFFWLMPFAIWLGNVRWKEGTIWYSVLIHFCFNVTACLFEFYNYG
jgi:membrane protease YdiL (CAAX protease family)